MKKDTELPEALKTRIENLRELSRPLVEEDKAKKARRDANEIAKDSFITERMRREGEFRNKGLSPDTL